MLINRKFGDYVLLRRLAIGGQSEVFLAVKVGPEVFSRPVVIKALPSRYRADDDFVRLFHKEAFISARFAHPHVVTVHDAKIIEGNYCMVMDFISGQTVLDIAQRGYQTNQPPQLQHIVRIIADACDGLDYVHDFRDLDAHHYAVVHRDVSPQNLMVTYQGVTKVFDFGIAQIAGYDQNENMMAGGKYAYMSPEQCRGERVDARSDVFSLGIILYELTTGYRLFRRKSQAAIIDAVCDEPIRPPTQLRTELPMFLEHCIMRALEREPDKRYQTSGHMRDDLLQFLNMISKGTERQELGTYVAALFEDERRQIADTLSEAKERSYSQVQKVQGPLEQVGKDFQPVEDITQELQVPMPEPRHPNESEEDYAQRRIQALRQLQVTPTDAQDRVSRETLHELSSQLSAVRDAEKTQRQRADYAFAELDQLKGELGRMRTRQTALMVLAVLLALITIALGVSQSGAASTERAEAASKP